MASSAPVDHIADHHDSTSPEFLLSCSSRVCLPPQSRRLRHLSRIALHNLTLSRPRARSVPRAVDDHALASPITDLQHDLPGLTHSRSSEQLRRIPDDEQDGSVLLTATTTLQRPSGVRQWSVARVEQPLQPRERQKVLQRAVDARSVDAFFSLHCKGADGPVYVSEVLERSVVSR